MDKNNMSFGMKIIIVIFAVILVVSLMLPFFSSCSNAASSNDSNADDTSTSDTSLSTVEGVDAVYQAKVDDLTSQLASDSTNMLATVNLGKTYMEWASALGQVDTSTLTATSKASASASDALALLNAMTAAADSGASDGEVAAQTSSAAADAVSALNAHIEETYAAAIPYFDAYLEQTASKSVTVDRAIAKYYSGDVNGAIEDLEAFVSDDDAFSPAWYNLGVFYEGSDRASDARDAFTKAISADQKDSYNMGTYALYQLSIMSALADASAGADVSASGDVEDGTVGGSAAGELADQTTATADGGSSSASE